MITLRCKETYHVAIEDLFSYITSPKSWVEWYPGTSSVNGPESTPKENETWVERLEVSGFKMKVDWIAKQVNAPHLCLMEGKMELSYGLGWLSHNATVMLRYDLQAGSEETQLERTMSYHFPNPLLRVADRLFLQDKTGRESREALANLKRILEAS